jgi:hypothetical protein
VSGVTGRELRAFLSTCSFEERSPAPTRQSGHHRGRWTVHHGAIVKGMRRIIVETDEGTRHE